MSSPEHRSGGPGAGTTPAPDPGPAQPREEHRGRPALRVLVDTGCRAAAAWLPLLPALVPGGRGGWVRPVAVPLRTADGTLAAATALAATVRAQVDSVDMVLTDLPAAVAAPVLIPVLARPALWWRVGPSGGAAAPVAVPDPHPAAGDRDAGLTAMAGPFPDPPGARHSSDAAPSDAPSDTLSDAPSDALAATVWADAVLRGWDQCPPLPGA